MEVFLGIYILGAVIAFYKVNLCEKFAPRNGKLIVVLMSWVGVFIFKC